jgi:hypothetical protein
MATSPTPMPDQSQQDPNAASQQGGGDPSQQSGAPSQGQANDLQMLLARWYQTAKQMSAADPRLASGMEKVAQGIQEAQTALVSPSQPTSLGQQPTY